MIPVQLKVKNFMSYGQDTPAISFVSFHLACLTGDNGNGKSALLDAITWALWGQARGVDKNGSGMDDLVRLGQEFMEVEFIFELEGDTYRIIRKRDKRRGLSLLELQIKNGDNYRGLSGNKISDTQKQITSILKMDYETFVNSAFVLQGKADTFTQQKPNDRKRILGEILGLNFYDELEKKAREKVREFEQEAKGLEQQILQLKQETKEKTTIQQHLVKIEEAHAIVTETIKSMEDSYESLLRQKKEHDDSLDKINQLEKRVNANFQEVKKLSQINSAVEQKIQEGMLLLNQEDKITFGFKQYQEKSQLKDELENKQQKYYQLSEQKEKLVSLIKEKRKLMELKIETLQQAIDSLTKVISEKEEKNELSSKLKVDLAKLEELNLQKEKKEALLMQLETKIAVLKAKIPDLNYKLEELKQNYLTLKKAPKCPLCSTDLTTETSKKKVLDLVAVEGKEIKASITSIEEEIGKLTEVVSETKDQIQSLNTSVQTYRLKEKEVTLIDRELIIIEEAEKKRTETEAKLNKLQLALYSGEHVQEEEQRLKSLSQEIDALNFDRSLYSKLIKEVEDYKVFSGQMNQLLITRDSLAQYQENAKFYQESIKGKTKDIEADKELIKLLQIRVEALASIPGNIKMLSRELETEKQKLSKLEQEKGAAVEKFKRCLELEEQQISKEKQWRLALQEKSYYSELVLAFGKKGIQAIIIENAIPELQEEANILLNRMTDGRLNVALITQKGNKKGTLVETLDIQISDELGTRKYEMYSGGEAFRVNFALRIALSKLLAKRAGARLQTLIIDEGFGTQDGKGKERLIELITAIQDDFEKIIVITHIQELKEAFPVHLEVKKNHNGSMVTII